MSGALASYLAALRASVLADAGVKTILGDPVRFHDEPPPAPIYPYATFSQLEARPAGSDAASASECLVTLHVWSRYGGRAEAISALGALQAAIEAGSPTGPDFLVVLQRAVFLDVFRAGDGRTTHGVLRVRAVIEHS